MSATFADQQAFLKEFHAAALSITQTKGQDYTPDGISLLEILPSCVEADISPEQALWVLYRKHFSAIKKHFFHHQELITEPVLGRLLDAANYFALLAWYDAHRADIHRAWVEYWEAERCECALLQTESIRHLDIPMCQRCETLSWMARRGFVPNFKGISSDSTRKAQG